MGGDQALTPDEQDLVLGLVVSPGQGPTRTIDEVLAHFGESGGATLALRLLRDAMERRDADDVEMALIVKGAAGASGEEFLHEDVVSSMGQLRSPRTVPALVEATRWIPEYLEFDECRALAVKAIWALGGIPGEEAQEALNRLRDAEDETVCQEAGKQLARLGEL